MFTPRTADWVGTGGNHRAAGEAPSCLSLLPAPPPPRRAAPLGWDWDSLQQPLLEEPEPRPGRGVCGPAVPSARASHEPAFANTRARRGPPRKCGFPPSCPLQFRTNKPVSLPPPHFEPPQSLEGSQWCFGMGPPSGWFPCRRGASLRGRSRCGRNERPPGELWEGQSELWTRCLLESCPRGVLGCCLQPFPGSDPSEQPGVW